MKIKTCSTVEEIVDISAKWKNLLKQCDIDNVFALPEWHIAWWNSIGKDKSMKILILYDDFEDVFGILPLAIQRGGASELFLKILMFSGGTQSDNNDIVLRNNDAEMFTKYFIPEIEKLTKKVDVVRFDNVPEDSILNKYSNDHNFEIIKKLRFPLPYTEILNKDYQDVLMSWKSSHRGDVRRQIKRISERGDLRLNIYSDKDEIINILEEYLKTHSIQWNKKFNSLYLSLHVFYKNLVNELWGNRVVHFSCLELNNKPVSFHFGFLYNSHFYWYKPTYNLKYYNFSPGKIHIAKLFEFGCSERWGVFDFLLGDEPYKKIGPIKQNMRKQHLLKVAEYLVLLEVTGI